MKEYPKKHEINCIGCGVTIKHLDPSFSERLEPNDMYNNGNVAEVYAGYGSRYDGNIYLVGVCDDCVNLNGIKVGEYM